MSVLVHAQPPAHLFNGSACSGLKELEKCENLTMFLDTTRELIPTHMVHLLYLQHHLSRPLVTILVCLPPALVAMGMRLIACKIRRKHRGLFVSYE